MMAEYRFLRTHQGVTRFAKVTVVSIASSCWSIVLSDAVRELGAVYGDAIQSGLSLAIAEQNQRGGQQYAITVTEIVETAVDTSTDAVECAAVVAAWKSFEEKEQDISIRFDGVRWKATFQ